MNHLIAGLILIFIAGCLQGAFVLPMTLTREWKWEHTWIMFSLFGMLIFNWAIGEAVLPNLLRAIEVTPPGNIHALLLFGAGWGVGAVLFGLAMEKLGMAVGYPIMMILSLTLGALIPLAQSGSAQFFTKPGLLLLAGTLVVLGGIVLCSQASAQKNLGQEEAPSSNGIGLAIAIFAGIFSSLPNIGLSNASELTASVKRFGAAPEIAGNAAWVVLFTAGFVVNFTYCIILIAKRRNAALFRRNWIGNLALVILMALMWLGSFYFYAMGAARMGHWGTIIGWPLFISLAILVGNVCGLWRGEWKTASVGARVQLNRGLIAVLFAVVLFSLGSALR